MGFSHISVLLEEVIEGLQIQADGTYVDGTLGGGGHAFEVCKKLTTGRFIGIDQDEAAITAASEKLKEFSDKVHIIRNNYRDMKSQLQQIGITSVQGILIDLGVSSYQLDTAERGFSYMLEGELDMRMDRRQPLTAKNIVNDYTEMELYRIIRDYGEDRFAKNIAKHIVMEREKAPIETTTQLNEVIRRAIPMKVQKTGGHPSKRTYQAIRIELNQELTVLKESIEDMVELLATKGRFCVITFHSLEDRIVKNMFRTLEDPCICPPDFPVCTCGRVSKGKVITRKPILPSAEELEGNSRSKSAKLRIFERV